MHRVTFILIAILALALVACGGTSTSESPAASVAASVAPPEPTPEPVETEEPTPEPAPSEDASGGGTGSTLVDLLPDSIAGESRTDLDMTDNPMFTQMLAESNADLEGVEMVISTYGTTGADPVGVVSMRVPGMSDAQLEGLARLMAGMSEGQASAEATTVGGKDVLAIAATGMGAGQTGYLYFADGAVFLVSAGSEDLAAELLSQLP